MLTDVRITGFVVGPIWWPVGVECYKPLNYSITREDARFSAPGTLRDHVLAATNDGDFQHCTIAQGRLVVTRLIGSRRVTRGWPLDYFPSVRDCLHPDGDDWFPPSAEE
jgi:hypothetical protein